MNIEVFNKFLETNLSTEGTDVWKIYYDFSKIIDDTVVINELYNSGDQYNNGCVFVEKNPGFIVDLNSGNFNNYPGSGFFSGDSILRISDYLNEENWTMFLTYINSNCEIDRSKSTILISNQFNLSDSSGFCFGFNGANKFFIEYNYFNSGKYTYTSDYEGKDNTCISLSKRLDYFELSVHDFANSENTLETFILKNYKNSNIYFLGNAYNNDINYTGFKGYMDDFLYFNNFIGYEQRNNLVKGIFCTGITPASTQLISSGVFNLIDSGEYIESGIAEITITGYANVPVGYIPTKGGLIQICQYSGITGIVYTPIFNFITGSETGEIQVSVSIPEKINYDFDRSQKFTNNRLKFLYNIDSNDFIEINTYTGFLDNYKTIKQYDDILEQFILDITSTGQSINLFNNGVLQISGINVNDNVVSGNYTLSGNLYVDSDLFFDQFNDSIIYFDITQTPEIIQFTGTGISYSLNNNLNNSIYLNGQKLISGINYSINGSNINFSGNILTTGQILATSHTDNIYKVFTGDLSSLTGNILPLTEEQIYLNGILQINDQNYIKTNCRSLLNSLFYPSLKTYNYYNNDEDSFNLL